MNLPILISLPHAGLDAPEELVGRHRLSPADIQADGDEGAAIIYDLAADAAAFVSTPIARAFVDQNRAPTDRRTDGVVKTHTCLGVPIYRHPLAEPLIQDLLQRYHTPYHKQLSRAARQTGIRVGVDCHTMLAVGPAVGPDPGQGRPRACISDGEGACPADYAARLRTCLEGTLGPPVTINDPFRGGYIVRSHAAELPWLQIEVSRAPFADLPAKQAAVRKALQRWCRQMGWIKHGIPD